MRFVLPPKQRERTRLKLWRMRMASREQGRSCVLKVRFRISQKLHSLWPWAPMTQVADEGAATLGAPKATFLFFRAAAADAATDCGWLERRALVLSPVE